ncbi:MAG: hypothetical protein IH804_03305 [Planctomycetes bacterium]|nr:hypothetical protein [Planctomycetota bacterium]
MTRKTSQHKAYRIPRHVQMHDVGYVARVRDGTFANALRRDHDQGFPWFERQRDSARRHAIESAGEVVRKMYEEGT